MFHKIISTQFDASIKRFRIDSAHDYFNQRLPTFFQQEGIVQGFFCVDTPQQNTAAKQKILHPLNVTRSLTSPSCSKLRGSCFNCCPSHKSDPYKILNNQSQLQYLSSYFPDFGLHTSLPLKVFGCVSSVHIHKQHRTNFILELLSVFSYDIPYSKGV